MTDRLLCGWQVRSQLDLPELLPWPGGGSLPDVEIEIGKAPAHLDNAVKAGPLIEIAPDGSCLLTVARVASYLVREGRRITIEPHVADDDAAIRAFLLGTVLAVLCYQRGLTALHASCVCVGDKAIALLGPSGMGKSTLAAAMVQKGATLVADDVTVIDFDGHGRPLVRPAIPRLKLWRNSLDALNIASEDLSPVRKNFQKFAMPAPLEVDRLPLATIYQLGEGTAGAAVRPSRLGGTDALKVLTSNTFRPRIWRAMARERAAMTAMMNILRHAGLYRVDFARNLSDLDALVGTLLAHHRNGAGG